MGFLALILVHVQEARGYPITTAEMLVDNLHEFNAIMNSHFAALKRDEMMMDGKIEIFATALDVVTSVQGGNKIDVFRFTREHDYITSVWGVQVRVLGNDFYDLARISEPHTLAQAVDDYLR